MTQALTFSFEFFPARDEASHDKLMVAAQGLQSLNPDFVSVTFGAGGSTKAGTYQTIKDLMAMGYDAAPHLSCVGATKAEIRELLATYQSMGVKRIVALRGDLPSGMGLGSELRHANDLVEFIRQETGNTFHIEVAAYPETHPQSRHPDDDLTHFINKMNAGANSAITQYFYNADAYFDFVDRALAKGITAPIIPGIMPITNYTQLARFSDMCGAEIPRWIRLRLASFGDDRASIKAFGLDVVANLCQTLLDGDAPGLHFYTMNSAEVTTKVWHQLNLSQYTA